MCVIEQWSIGHSPKGSMKREIDFSFAMEDSILLNGNKEEAVTVPKKAEF